VGMVIQKTEIVAIRYIDSFSSKKPQEFVAYRGIGVDLF